MGDAYCGTYDMIYLDEARMRTIRSDQWKLVVYLDKDGHLLAGGSRHELFDLENDPEELNSLYGKQSVAAVHQQLETRLPAWMREAGVTKKRETSND